MSSRYARLTLVLVLLALVPTVVNSYFGATTVEGPSVGEMVPETIGALSSSPTKRRDASIRRTFDSIDWLERHYRGQGADVTLLVVRSFDMKRLYHHPELAVASDMEFRAARLVQYPSPQGDLDVHVLEGERGGLVAYALLYGEDTIARPLLFQLLVAPELLLSGRRPLTLVMATDEAHVPGRDTGGAPSGPAFTLVQAAVDRLRAAQGR